MILLRYLMLSKHSIHKQRLLLMEPPRPKTPSHSFPTLQSGVAGQAVQQPQTRRSFLAAAMKIIEPTVGQGKLHTRVQPVTESARRTTDILIYSILTPNIRMSASSSRAPPPPDPQSEGEANTQSIVDLLVTLECSEQHTSPQVQTFTYVQTEQTERKQTKSLQAQPRQTLTPP